MSAARATSSLLAVLLTAACAAPHAPEARTIATPAVARAAAEAWSVSAWPEATARFRGPGPWLGADSAYSVDLGRGRVLWLFGDTFHDPARDGSRVDGPNVFLRNTIALQTPAAAPGGAPVLYDLSQSELEFITGPERDGVPSSYFADAEGGDWFWPLDGQLLPDGKLLLFRMRVAKVPLDFGFEVRGWDAVAVDEPGRSPRDWTLRPIGGEPLGAERLLGSSVLLHERFLYVYAALNQDEDHALYLARFALDELRGLSAGVLDDPEWYTAAGYRRRSAGAVPSVVIPDGQIEISVHFEPRLGRFVEVQTLGLFASDPSTAIVLRTAPRPEGPWSAPTPIHAPPPRPGTDPSKLLTYAAKAHPEQRGRDEAARVLTYMQNDVSSGVPADSVYYPEVLTLRPTTGESDLGRGEPRERVLDSAI